MAKILYSTCVKCGRYTSYIIRRGKQCEQPWCRWCIYDEQVAEGVPYINRVRLPNPYDD